MEVKNQKTVQEIDREINEKQQSDADELMQRMFSFISLDKKFPAGALISAKFCAKVACDYLIENLPNINNTPPIKRKEERAYRQYWNGVKSKLENFKTSSQNQKS